MSRQLYPMVAGPVPTTLLTPFKYGDTQSIELESVSDIPSAPNIITITDDDAFISLAYTVKDGKTLSGLTYIEGDQYYQFLDGSRVVRAVTKYDFDAIQERIEECEELQITINGVPLAKEDNKIDLPPATVDTIGLVKPGENISISSDGTISASSGIISYPELTNKPQINSVELVGNKTSSDLGIVPSSHLTDNNPHGITKLTLGLGNVDNTRDMDKPVSTATQTAINGRAPLSHVSDKGNPHGVTKDQIGLGNVNNTSDAAKPISSATQAALDNKADKEYVDTELNDKVDKVGGKGLSTNDFTDSYRNKIDNDHDNLSDHIVNTNNPHSVTKGQIGLGDVDNTSDLSKPISTATQEALDLKASASTLSTHINTVNAHSVTAELLGLGNVDNTSDVDKPVSTAVQSALDGKVDKVSGKQLSTNDFTNDYKTKIDNSSASVDSHIADISNPHHVTAYQIGVESGAQVNVIEHINLGGSRLYPTDKTVNIPVATTASLGAVKVGANLSITSDGTLNALASEAQQSDWNEADSSKPDYIKNKPTALSDFTDDIGIQTELDVSTAIGGHDESSTAHSDIRTALTTEEERAQGVETYLQTQIDAIESKSDVKDVKGTYAEVDPSDYDVGDVIKVLADETHGGTTTYYKIVESSGVKSLEFVGEGGQYYTKAETDEYFVPVQRTINGLELTQNITLTKSHISDLSNVDNTSDLDKPISTLTQTALDTKVDIVEGKQLSTNDFTTTLKDKLDGIESGAQVNIQSDWTASSGDAFIKNKPTLGGAAYLNVGTVQGTVCAGNDERLTAPRAPTAHKTTHALGGTDAISPADIGAEPEIAIKGTAFNKDFGTTSGTVCQGDDVRLTNARAPTSHASTHASDGADPITPADIGAEPAFTKGTAFNKDFGTGHDDVCRGDDSRLTDARAPTAHATTHVSGNDAIPAATTSTAGLMSASDKARLSVVNTQMLVPVTDVTIVPSDWEYQDVPEVIGCPWMASISIPDCTSSHYVWIALSQTDATSGNIAHVCETTAGAVKIFAQTQPENDVHIDTVIALARK